MSFKVSVVDEETTSERLGLKELEEEGTVG